MPKEILFCYSYFITRRTPFYLKSNLQNFLHWISISLGTPSRPALPVFQGSWCQGLTWHRVGVICDHPETLSQKKRVCQTAIICLPGTSPLFWEQHIFWGTVSPQIPTIKFGYGPTMALAINTSISEAKAIPSPRFSALELGKKKRYTNRKTKDVTLALVSNLSTARWKNSV